MWFHKSSNSRFQLPNPTAAAQQKMPHEVLRSMLRVMIHLRVAEGGSDCPSVLLSLVSMSTIVKKSAGGSLDCGDIVDVLPMVEETIARARQTQLECRQKIADLGGVSSDHELVRQLASAKGLDRALDVVRRYGPSLKKMLCAAIREAYRQFEGE